MILSRSSVVGIDLGNTSAVVCIARNQKLETLVNEEGSRRTESLISFRDGQRLIGNKAKPEEINNFANTLSYYKRFLGRRHDDPSIEKELGHIAYTTRASESGSVEFVVQHDGQEEVISPEQAVAMMLGKLRKIVESEMGGQEMHDCVICCPPYWGDHERRLLIDSAKVVGLNVVRVMNETTAVAAAYGLLRPLPKEPRHVLFVDVGVASTCASVVRLVEGEVRVISTACDPHLGGRDFDALIFEHVCDQIKTQYKLDVRANRKASVKLRRECARVRIVLSANSTAKYELESFMDGKDVKGQITRDDLEQWSVPLVDRLAAPITEALAEAKLEASALFAVEVIGGTTRMPCVQKSLVACVGRALSFTCDGDESAAKGACLQCALLSPSFKMKAFEIVDIVPYSLKLRYEKTPGSTNEFEEAVLYKRFSPFPSLRDITFKNYTKPFLIQVEYDNPKQHSRALNYAYLEQPAIAKFRCSGMESYVEPGDPMRMKVRVKLDMHGIVSVSSAQLLKREVVETKIDESKAAEIAAKDKAKVTADDTKCQKCEKTKKEAEVAEMLMCPECKATWCTEACRVADEKAHSADCKPDTEKKAEGDAPATKTRLKRIDLKVETISGPFLRTEKGTALPPETINALIAQEEKMLQKDSLIEGCVNARNQLEAYVFDFRAELDHSLKPFVLSEESEAVQEKMNTIQEWFEEQMDGDDWAASRATYEAKLAEAKAIGDPIIERKRNAFSREDVIHRFESTVSRIRAGANDLLAKIASGPSTPAVAAAPAEVKDPLSIKCEMCPKTARDVGKRLMRCTNCYSANYCSKECQKAHWATHKKNCVKRPPPAEEPVATMHMPAATTTEATTTETTTATATTTAPAATSTPAPTVDESEPVRKLLDAVTAAEKWLADLQEKQSKLGVAAAPVLQVNQVEAKIQALETQWHPLRKDLSAPAKKQKQEAKPDEGKTEAPGEALQIEMAPSSETAPAS